MKRPWSEYRPARAMMACPQCRMPAGKQCRTHGGTRAKTGDHVARWTAWCKAGRPMPPAEPGEVPQRPPRGGVRATNYVLHIPRASPKGTTFCNRRAAAVNCVGDIDEIEQNPDAQCRVCMAAWRRTAPKGGTKRRLPDRVQTRIGFLTILAWHIAQADAQAPLLRCMSENHHK